MDVELERERELSSVEMMGTRKERATGDFGSVFIFLDTMRKFDGRGAKNRIIVKPKPLFHEISLQRDP